MFYLKGITKLHIEITNKCNAKCPICIRTRHNGNNLIPKEISFKDFKIFFPTTFFKNLKTLQFCGNYGDPIMSQDLLVIHDYVRTINPNIQFTMSTNGGIRDRIFWKDLAQYYSKDAISNSHVVFCIDGLEDTNHLYRRNVTWDRVLDNLKVFTENNGNAHWRFIPFKHNQHQIEDAKKLSQDLNCTLFKLKISSRLSKQKNVVFEYTDNNRQIVLLDQDIFDIQVRMKDPTDNKITCRNQHLGELYVDAHGLVYPCCWLATQTWCQLNQNSLYTNSLDNILKNDFFTKGIYNTIDADVRPCKERCGSLAFTTSHIYLENDIFTLATPWNTEIVRHED